MWFRMISGHTSEFPSIHPFCCHPSPPTCFIKPSNFWLGKKKFYNQPPNQPTVGWQAWWMCMRLQQLLNAMNPCTSAWRTTAPPPRAVPPTSEDLTNFMECWPTRSALTEFFLRVESLLKTANITETRGWFFVVEKKGPFRFGSYKNLVINALRLFFSGWFLILLQYS